MSAQRLEGIQRMHLDLAPVQNSPWLFISGHRDRITSSAQMLSENSEVSFKQAWGLLKSRNSDLKLSTK